MERSLFPAIVLKRIASFEAQRTWSDTVPLGSGLSA